MIEPSLLQVRGLCKTYQNRTGLFRRQAVEAIKQLQGHGPAGYRSPAWDLSDRTIDLIRQHGCRYDSSMMGNDHMPYRVRLGDVRDALANTLGVAVGLSLTFTPLQFLLDPANVHALDVDFQGRRRRILEFRYGGHRIWGATAAMLVNFRQRLEQG